MNVIILSGSTGGGHNRASNALKAAILKNEPDAKVDIIDVFAECSKFLNIAVTQGYRILAQKAPSLYGAMYRSSDKDTPMFDLMSGLNIQCGKKLYPIIKERQPDVVVCCHPFAVTMMSTINEKLDYNIPTIAVITDFMPHMAYICDNMDAYVTPSEETARVLVEKYNVDPSIVYPLGLPLFERFYKSEDFDREAFLSSMSFDPKLKTILIMAGSFGVTDILQIYETLVDIDTEFQMFVITGKNQKLYDAFENLLSDETRFETQDAPDFILNLSEDNLIKQMYYLSEEIRDTIVSTFERTTTKKKPTRLFYFVDNVEDFMHSSDLIITKPGGLTTSESIVSHLPMAIFKAFPGQEAQNAEYLVNSGIAVMLKEGDELKAQITELLEDNEKLEHMKEACRRHAAENSADRLYELIKKISDKKAE